MVAFPEPDDPDVIVSHGWSLDTVQAHPATRFALNVPPAAGTDCVPGDPE